VALAAVDQLQPFPREAVHLKGLGERALERGGAVFEDRLAVRDDYELDRKLSEALLPLIMDGPERDCQLEGLARVKARMRQTGEAPSEKAAKIVLDHLRRRN